MKNTCIYMVDDDHDLCEAVVGFCVRLIWP